MGFSEIGEASIAQLVEQLICNQSVGGSSPFAGSVKGVENVLYKDQIG